MRSAFPRVYQSFAEFEREELRKLDRMSSSIDDMIDEAFAEELDFDDSTSKKSRRHDEDED
jgi:hypothetical protein